MGLTPRLAWRNLWRHPRRTWLTLGAMVFSNVLLVFLISLQLGMYRLMIDNTLQAFTGHLQVQAPGYLDDRKMRQSLPQVEALAADETPHAVSALRRALQRPLAITELAQPAAQDRNRAAARLVDAGSQVQERRLAAAAAAYDRNPEARLDPRRHASQRVPLPSIHLGVALPDILEAECFSRHAHGPSPVY